VTFSEERVKGPTNEAETKKIFADAGLDWKNRKERYEGLKDTIFHQVDNGEWWIAYNEEDKPISSQGIGRFEGVYLLLGLQSFAKQLEAGEGYGEGIARYVSDRHTDKPKIGSARSGGGKHIYKNKLKFKELTIKDGFLQGNEDLPTEVKSALEIASGKDRGGQMPIRKLYWMEAASWFYTLKR